MRENKEASVAWAAASSNPGQQPLLWRTQWARQHHLARHEPAASLLSTIGPLSSHCPPMSDQGQVPLAPWSHRVSGHCLSVTHTQAHLAHIRHLCKQYCKNIYLHVLEKLNITQIVEEMQFEETRAVIGQNKLVGVSSQTLSQVPGPGTGHRPIVLSAVLCPSQAILIIIQSQS